MYKQNITYDTPDATFVRVKNGYSTASLTAGQAVSFSGTAADGITVTQPATANLKLFAGIVKGTIAYGSYGYAQCYGYNSDALVTGATDVAVNDALKTANGSFSLAKDAYSTVTTGKSDLVVALQAFTTSTAAAKKVFVRAM